MQNPKRKHSILVADDDRQLVEMLRTRLAYEGYRTWAAYEGMKTVETVLKKKPDLILLDLWMPAGTGVTVLERLQTRREARKIPVIVLTALEKPDLEKEIKEKGAQAVLKKPYAMKKLLSLIRQLLPTS